MGISGPQKLLHLNTGSALLHLREGRLAGRPWQAQMRRSPPLMRSGGVIRVEFLASERPGRTMGQRPHTSAGGLEIIGALVEDLDRTFEQQFGPRGSTSALVIPA